MTTGDDMTPRRPYETEQLEDLFSDALDLVDETVARIADADVSEHLRKVLSQSGYTGQLPGRWPPPHRIDLDRPLDAAITPEYREMANLAATMQANGRLSRENLQQAKQTLADARQEAEQIVDAARDEALQQAAQLIHEARKQADQIISAARREAERIVEAEQIVTAARDTKSCAADSECLHVPCFQIQLYARDCGQAHRQANACVYHVGDVVQALRTWAAEHGVIDGALTILAIEPATGGRQPPSAPPQPHHDASELGQLVKLVGSEPEFLALEALPQRSL